MRAILRTGVGVALLLAAASAGAQDIRLPADDALRPRTFAVPVLDAGPLTLAEAVRLTILFNPSVTRATQSVEAAAGRHREFRDPFDSRVTVAPRVTYIQRPASPFMLKQQRDTRQLINHIYDAYTRLTVELRTMAEDLQPRAPFCPSIGGSLLTSYQLNRPSGTQQFQTTSIYQDTLDEQEKAQIGATSDFAVPGLPDFSDLAAQTDFCSMTAGPDPLTEAALYFNMYNKVKNVNFWGQQTAGTVVESLSQIPREEALYKAQIAETVATRARLAWERLGLVPIDELQRQFTLDASFDRAFRNGIGLQATVQMRTGEQNFKDKPFDPSFGGMGIPTRFAPEISAGFSLPLGKGRGATATAAPERAAAFAVEAQREQVRHAASEEVLRTVLAYLELVAMQDTLTFAEESARIVERVRVLTEQQVNAGDIPAVEMERVRARAASLRALVTDARGSLMDARLGLARNIGLDTTSAVTQLRAANVFATEVRSVPPVTTLVQQALTQRRDVRSVAQLAKATGALDAGARADMRRVFDLGVRGGLSNLYESPHFKYLPDEEMDVPIFSCNQNRNSSAPECVSKPGHSTLTPVRFFEPKGWGRAISKRWEPFVEARFTIELPFGNNAARGRARQTGADLRARHIDAVDLERHITQSLVSTTRSLQAAAASLEHTAEAVRYDAQIVDLALEQFSARELTLIDALQTEEQVTQDRLALVRQRQAYLSLLARLKFETGELLAMGDPSGGGLLTFQPSDFVAK
jgi:hypothetical protein